MLQRGISCCLVILSVCLCLSQVGLLSKRLEIELSWFWHRGSFDCIIRKFGYLQNNGTFLWKASLTPDFLISPWHVDRCNVCQLRWTKLKAKCDILATVDRRETLSDVRKRKFHSPADACAFWKQLGGV